MTFHRAILISSAQVSIERPPAGLAFLAGICEHNQLDYDIFDFNLFIKNNCDPTMYRKLEHLSTQMKFNNIDKNILSVIDQITALAVDKILSYGADLIAVTSLSSFQIAWTDKLLSHLRPKTSATILVGGPGISYEQETNKTAGKLLAEKGLIDYYLLGEGDWALDNFLKGKIDQGVNHKDDSIETWVPQLDDLTNLILPTYKKFDLSPYGYYKTVDQYSKLPLTLPVMGSRGCVRRCSFCDVGHLWKKYRIRPAADVVDEMIKHYKEIGCLNYWFNDNLINGSLKQFSEICQLLIDLKKSDPVLENLKYSGLFIIRPKQHHPESFFKLLKDSGCYHFEIGIESGSEAVRYHMGKKFDNIDIDYHFEMCNKYGIRNFVLMFPAYPTETLEDHQATIDFYKRYQKYIINDIIMGTSLSAPMGIYKNTPIHSMIDELGIVMVDEQYENISNWTPSSNPQLNIKERYRRFIELALLVLDLGYPKGSADLMHLQMHIDDIQDVVDNKPKLEIKLKKDEVFRIIPISITSTVD